MKEVKCTRGFGEIQDPETGDSYNVEHDNTVEVSAKVAQRLKEAHSGIVVSEVASSPSESGGSTGEDTDAEEEAYNCGVNDCSRSVESEDATCWQH